VHALVAGQALGQGGSSKTSTAPMTSPRIPTNPVVGCMRAEASCSIVVLPAPLGPRTTQRSPSATSQVTSSSSRVLPRTTLTEASSRTSLIGPPP
jgi:hypothetical protein